mgnify:CR=1 FL=1
MTNKPADPQDTMTVTAIMGLNATPFRTDWRMTAFDCNGGEWAVEFSSTGSSDWKYAFAQAVRAAVAANNYAENPNGVEVWCIYDNSRDMHYVFCNTYVIRLEHLTFTPIADPA